MLNTAPAGTSPMFSYYYKTRLAKNKEHNQTCLYHKMCLKLVVAFKTYQFTAP